MKLFKPVALVAAGILMGGAVTVSAVTTTDPVTLCIAKSGTVRESAGDTCTAKETRVQVASAADVAALVGRLDSAEQSVADLERVVGGEIVLELGTIDNGTWRFTTTGYHLTPFSPVSGWYTDAAGVLTQFQDTGIPGDQGTLFDTFGFSCGLAQTVYVVGQGALGEVTSNTLTAPC